MERTYVFNSDGGNGGSGGSKLDITAMLPGMFGNKGIDPNLLAMLNPEFAAKQQQEQEISALKGQMSNMDKNMQEMSKNMADLIAQNQKLMEQLGVVEASKNKK